MPALTTNFALVDVDDAMIEVGTLSPYSEERHRALEQQHHADYVFRRRGDALEVVKTNAAAASLDIPKAERPARRLGGLLNVLIERGFERHVLRTSTSVTVVRRRPLEVVSLESKNDVAHDLFGGASSGRLPLHVRRGFRMEARTLHLTKGRRAALIVDAITHADIDGTCADLIRDKFDLRGLYVRSLDPADARPGLPRPPPTVGQVQQVEGSVVHLGSDRRSERSEYNADQLGLDLGPAALPRLAAHYVGPDAHEKLWDERNTLAMGAQRWKRISGFVQHLSQGSFEIAPGVNARLAGWVTAANLGASCAKLPRFLVGDGKVADATTGVFGHGPRYVPKAASNGIRACVLCERAHRGEVDAFLNALCGGSGRHGALAKTWKIGAVTFDVFEADGPAASDYERACRAAIDAGTAWQLAFVQVPSGTKEFLGEQNPYLVTKAKFLARNIPVQEFRVETMQKPASQLQWALGGMGLQMFAKLGGVPWLLQTDTQVHEVVLGLGSANLGTGRFGDRDRVVGLTTAFSGDGTYWLTETSRTAKVEEHEDAVVESAVAAFKLARENMAWRNGDAVRVVLHSHKDLRDKHVEELKRAVLEVAGDAFKVDFAFVHIAEKHPILLFDPTEAQQIPMRGSVVRLGNSEALISVLGPKEVRNDRLGFPRPVCLKVHRSSTFTDLDYLSWQALAFASLSWRNFTPTSAPVTVQYARWIADLLGRLGSLPRWDPDTLRGNAGTSRWFL